MSVVSELIRTEADGTISFGNYELPAKSKKSDFEHDGDLYKVKTFKEITKLERNGMFVYESVPGTAVSHLKATENGMSFTVECPTDAQITVELEEETSYQVQFIIAKADALIFFCTDQFLYYCHNLMSSQRLFCCVLPNTCELFHSILVFLIITLTTFFDQYPDQDLISFLFLVVC